MSIKKVILEELRELIQTTIDKKIQVEAYKWRPSASQRREFARRMQDPEEKAAYEKRKLDKANKRRAGSRFDYGSAGGNYIPTQSQYNFVMNNMDLFTAPDEREAANKVIQGYTCKEKIHHDYIHIVNEKIRKQQ